MPLRIIIVDPTKGSLRLNPSFYECCEPSYPNGKSESKTQRMGLHTIHHPVTLANALQCCAGLARKACTEIDEVVSVAQAGRTCIEGIQDLFVQVNGMRVHLQRSGDGPPLLLLHGLVGSAKNWQQNVGFLSRYATVYAVDLFNMGESERVPGLNAGLEATADGLAALLDALRIDEADIAGHSHGGAVAMMLAARHPGRVRKMVLFAPANPFCSFGDQLIRFYQTRLGTWFARRVPALPRRLKATALSRMYGDPSRVAEGTLDGYISGLQIPGTIDHILRILASWFDDMRALREALVELAEMPTLLIWGDRDRTVGLPSAHRLRQILLRSELLVMPGVGHIPFAEMPDECNLAMREWLAEPLALQTTGPRAA